MADQDSVKRAFPIDDYRENFVNFINHYGITKQGKDYRWYPSGTALMHRVMLDDKVLAWIDFKFDVLSSGQLIVTAEIQPVDTYATTVSASALQYFNVLSQAILEKYQLDDKEQSPDPLLLTAKERHWLEVCKQALAAQANGQDIKAFCQLKGISERTERKWRKKLSQKGLL